MGYAYASGVVKADAQAVWELVRRFDALPVWHPFVESCAMLNADHPAAVGSQRIQQLANGGRATAKLISMDDANRSLVYEMLDGPWLVRNYVATVSLYPVTDEGSTFVEWWGRFDADVADVDELAAVFRDGTYQAGVEALQQWFGGSTGRTSSASGRAPVTANGHRKES